MRDDKNTTEVPAGERGAALPLIALSLAGLLIVTWLLLGVTQRVVARADAQAAADATALAGAMNGRTTATRVASANGAIVISFSSTGNRVDVVIERDGVRAVANAERRLSFD